MKGYGRMARAVGLLNILVLMGFVCTTPERQEAREACCDFRLFLARYFDVPLCSFLGCCTETLGRT